jgi:hypothetical protein
MTFYREHRPLQAYIDALLVAGFSIEKLVELTDEAEGKPIPMFLDILAVRRPREIDPRKLPVPRGAKVLKTRHAIGLALLSGLSGLAVMAMALLAVRH